MLLLNVTSCKKKIALLLIEIFERRFNTTKMATWKRVAFCYLSGFNIGRAVLYFTCLSATLDCMLDTPGMPANLSVIKD